MFQIQLRESSDTRAGKVLIQEILTMIKLKIRSLYWIKTTLTMIIVMTIARSSFPFTENFVVLVLTGSPSNIIGTFISPKEFLAISSGCRRLEFEEIIFAYAFIQWSFKTCSTCKIFQGPILGYPCLPHKENSSGI